MAQTKKQRDWLSPLDVPEGQEGEYRIEYLTIPAGEKVMLNNFRNQMFGGQKGPANLIYDVDTKWRQLIGPSGVWMSDLPVEQRQMEECIKGMKGRVLVGGLGLGLAATLLIKKKTVSHVDVVEIQPEVIKLVGPYTHNRWNPRGKYRGWVYKIIQADLFSYLEDYTGEPYDYTFYDIWQSDSENTFFDVVCPLWNLSEGKVKHFPVAWNSQVMRGQLFHSIQGNLFYLRPEAKEHLEAIPGQREYLAKLCSPDKTGDIWIDWRQPFFRWHERKKPDPESAILMAQLYAGIYGTWGWEARWRKFSGEGVGS